jgi:hypothetical protein
MVSLCLIAVVAAQDGDVVSYEEYQLLRVYPSTAQQMQMVLDLVKKRKYEGLVSLWSQNLIAGRTSGNSSNRSEPSADLLSAPQVLDDLVEQLDGSGISYDVLIHNLEVRKTHIHGVVISAPGWLSRYSDHVWAGWPRGRSSSPGGVKIFLLSTASSQF